MKVGSRRPGRVSIRLLDLLALTAALALTAPAASAQEWFDAYERGLQALQQKRADRAVESFERAIRQRPEPGNNVLTYGTNRLAAYYPYLRLAEAQLLAGKPDAARRALELSEQRGREPADERSRIAALVTSAEAAANARAAAAAPPATTVAAAPVPAPTPVAQAPPSAVTPAPIPAVAAASPAAGAGGMPAGAPSPPESAETTAKGTLDLRSTPDGAAVLLSGSTLLGRTPLRVDLAPGIHTLTLRREGTADQTFTVRVNAGRVTTETRTLVATVAEPAATVAAEPAVTSLVVYSDPPGATVYFDDEPLGATDPASGRLVKTGVAVGRHRVRLTHRGRDDFSSDVDVASAGPTTVRAALPASTASGIGAPVWVSLAVVSLLAILFMVRRGRSSVPSPTVLMEPGRSTASSHTSSATAAPHTVTTMAPTRAGATQRTPAGTSGQRPTAVPAATVREGLDSLVEDLDTRAFATPPRPAGVGERFGDYLLLEQLGRGGMAAVFRAERNGEELALKRPLPNFLDDPEFLERFLREAEIGRTLHHPNIIRIFERGSVDGIPYFTMELVRGETLQQRGRRSGAFTPKTAARVVAQVAEALDYAHLKGVVHRDLKPSNIMILADDTVKVMDYGIARAKRFQGLTLTGAFLGTPDYVAPETAEGRGTDARSDLYSLGVVFYEILTGNKPFVGDTPFATLRKHCTEIPRPPSELAPGTPPALEAIVMRLLAKNPDERHPGAEELLIELRDYLNRAA